MEKRTMTDTNESTGLLEAPYVASHDQRRWPRFRPEETETYLILEDERISVEIVDECHDGIGLLVRQRVELQVEDLVELVYCDVPVCGMVRSISQQGQQIRLGIQWNRRRQGPPEARRPRCRTESDYILLGELPVACRVFDQKDGELVVRLPDGTEAEVASDDICVINRFQRLADLKQAAVELRVLAAFYQLGALQSTDDVLRAVLNLEFAPSWD